MVKWPWSKRDVGRRSLQHVGGKVLAFFDDLCRGFDDCGAGVHDRFRAAGAAAGDEPVAVALHQRNLVEGNAEFFAEHLRERRSVAHAEIERAGSQRHRAVGIEFDIGKFLRRRRRDFEKIADAEAAQLAALAAFALSAREVFAVGEFEGLLGQRREVAAVVGSAGRGFVRQVARADLITLAQRNAVDPHLGRGRVDQPFHIIIAFRPAGAAIGGDVRGVGEHALARDFDQRRAVHALHVFHGVDACPAWARPATGTRPYWRRPSAARRGNYRRHRAQARPPRRDCGRDCRRQSFPSARRSTSPGGRARAPHAARRYIRETPRPSCRTSRRPGR